MSIKNQKRVRRAARSKRMIKASDIHRIAIHKTPKHIYAQLLSPDGSMVLASASTLSKELKSKLKNTGNIEAAKAVGKLIAQRVKEAKIDKIAFDRSGFKYHGRVKAVAEAAREAGVNF